MCTNTKALLRQDFLIHYILYDSKPVQITISFETFSSSLNDKQYKIQGHQTFRSDNLVYQLECNKFQAR